MVERFILFNLTQNLVQEKLKLRPIYNLIKYVLGGNIRLHEGLKLINEAFLMPLIENAL